jgi:hypothetical protein
MMEDGIEENESKEDEPEKVGVSVGRITVRITRIDIQPMLHHMRKWDTEV